MDINNSMASSFNASMTINSNQSYVHCGLDSQRVSLAKLIAFIILMVAALAGNILVCLIVYKNTKMRNTLNYLLVNMAISDLVIPILASTTRIVELSTQNSEWRVEGDIGDFLCKFVFFVLDMSPIVSILSLVLITFDRFAAVVFPFMATKLSSRFRKYFIGLTWIIAMAFCSPHFYAVKLQNKFCVMDWDSIRARVFYTIMLMILFIIIPFVLLLVMYSMILYKMKTRPKDLNQTDKGRRRRQLSKRNITLLSFAVVLVYAFCWGPYFTILMVATFKWRWDLSHVPCYWNDIVFVIQYLAYSNAAINPLLYFIFLKNYRTGLKNIIPMIRCFNRYRVIKTARSLMVRNTSQRDNGNTVEIEARL
ncbi:QRFP-like peptide receptor [Actinia tenebrosa]|uniref:QRFP-like peptide receptor n=1 Tax=Actinia tenebrosa TaxID=6105 RepID=A0A6P8HFP2_ACTTE|nr:QRFP-like peptide receptor [Actinia tenebrosa]XP_031554627.1 QRFP-like peptide receptor [Actinia tenebrosa]